MGRLDCYSPMETLLSAQTTVFDKMLVVSQSPLEFSSSWLP